MLLGAFSIVLEIRIWDQWGENILRIRKYHLNAAERVTEKKLILPNCLTDTTDIFPIFTRKYIIINGLQRIRNCIRIVFARGFNGYLENRG